MISPAFQSLSAVDGESSQVHPVVVFDSRFVFHIRIFLLQIENPVQQLTIFATTLLQLILLFEAFSSANIKNYFSFNKLMFQDLSSLWSLGCRYLTLIRIRKIQQKIASIYLILNSIFATRSSDLLAAFSASKHSASFLMSAIFVFSNSVLSESYSS